MLHIHLLNNAMKITVRLQTFTPGSINMYVYILATLLTFFNKHVPVEFR